MMIKILPLLFLPMINCFTIPTVTTTHHLHLYSKIGTLSRKQSTIINNRIKNSDKYIIQQLHLLYQYPITVPLKNLHYQSSVRLGVCRFQSCTFIAPEINRYSLKMSSKNDDNNDNNNNQQIPVVSNDTTTTTTTTTTSTTNDLLTDMGLPSPLILGSGSFTRKAILAEMNIPYKVIVYPIDEKNIGNRTMDSPDVLVLKLATAKMEHLLQQLQLPVAANNDTDTDKKPDTLEYIVLTADQVVTCNGKILEKAESIEEAIEFVSLYGTYPCTTVGSIVLTHVPSLKQVSIVDTATIYFKQSITNDASTIINDLISLYNEPILSCAGALMIEHPLIQQYITNTTGTQDNIMGLCKNSVLLLLQQLQKEINNNTTSTTRTST